MDYRALNINDFNALNMSEADQTAAVDTMYDNMDAYIQRGRVARSHAFHKAMTSAWQSVRGLVS